MVGLIEEVGFMLRIVDQLLATHTVDLDVGLAESTLPPELN